MAKLTKKDYITYMRIAVDVTKNYAQAAGHGPMIENIYRGLIKMHEQIPDDAGDAEETPEAS